MSISEAPNPFPNQIIFEILTRLPAKHLHRFKCVSKHWLSLITSPPFITSYISRNSTPLWTILDRTIRLKKINTPNELLTLSLSQPPNITTLTVSPHLVDLDLVDPTYRKFPVILSGSNGLILVAIAQKRDTKTENKKNPNYFSHETQQDSLVVCNPITRQWYELPKPPTPFNDRRCIGFATRPRAGGEPGFVVTEYQPFIGSEHACLMTFSSETGKWEVKSGSYLLGLRFWRPAGVVEFDGRLFWVDVSFGLIVCDDPFSTEKKVQCGFIPLPEGCYRRFDTPGLEKERCVGVSGGGIQYLEVVEDGGFVRLWRLKNWQEGEWGLVYKVEVKDVWADESYLSYGLPKVNPKTSVLHPFKEDVVFFVAGGCIFELDVGKKKVLSCGVYSSLMEIDIAFVIPSWPTSFLPTLLASLAKDRGNEHFKKKNFKEAIDCYSNSIHHLPTPQAYANRAAACLNMCNYLQAEIDCTEALKLDAQYIKVYARRAVARKELGKFKQAKEDAELCLKLDPGQNDIQKLLVELNSSLEKANIKGEGKDEIVPEM